MLKAVNDYRLLQQDQIQRLLFPSKNTAQVRLQKLWANGFLKRYFFNVMTGYLTSPVLYGIDTKGVAILRQAYGYSDDELRYSKQNTFSDDFLRHTIGLSEVRLNLKLAVSQHNMAIMTWADEKYFKGSVDRVQIGQQLVPIVPDGYCKLTDSEDYHYHFFIEYDRGTEGLRFFKKKIAGYGAYLQSRMCKERYGTLAIRVLTVVEGNSGSKRLKTLQKATEEASGGRWFFFASLDELVEGDALYDPIWRQFDGQQWPLLS